jgi:hypothetical protein
MIAALMCISDLCHFIKIFVVNKILTFFLLLSFSTQGQLFSESFAYPKGSLLTNLSWSEHSGGGTNPIQISEGLTFGGAKLNGGVQLSGGGQDVNTTFEPQNSVPVFASFLVRVESASSDGEYFFHLGPKNLGTTFRGKVFVRSSGNGVQFGLSKSSNNPNYSEEVYDLNRTYQVVLKYTFIGTSNSDDIVELFVVETPQENQPKTIVLAPSGESDASYLGSVAFRQGSTNNAAILKLDELRIANNWKDAVSLKRELSIALKLPENLYAFSSKCTSEPIFNATLEAYWPETQLNLWSPSANVMEFSIDGLHWSNQLIFRSSDNSYHRPFFVKMLTTDPANGKKELTISIDNYGAEVIDHVKASYSVFDLREDCSMAISDVKLLQLSDSVKVSGRITASAREFSGFNYIQDNTSGIRIQGDFEFKIGDSIQFYGVLSELNLEQVLTVNSLSGFQVFDSKVLDPKLIKIEDLDAHKGELVKVEDVRLKDEKFVFLPNSNESIEANNRVWPMRIWSKTKIDGHLKPLGKFDVIGVVGQYRNQFQLYPRLVSDIENLGEIPSSLINVSKEYTFDLAAWNLEWFGSETNGPVDDAMQFENASKVLNDIDADVYVLEEITNTTSFDKLVATLDGYNGECSPAVSGGGEPANAQRVCFVYKRETISMVELRPLLGGTPPIAGYPDTFERFWASGRLPALFVCDATIDGVKRRLHIVGIHARANRDGSPDERKLVYDMRKKDIEVLKDSLDQYFSLASVIMAGDFNDDVDETVVTGLTESTYASFINDPSHWQALSKELSDKGHKSYIGYDNVIDHVVISNELFSSAIDMGTELQLPFIDIDDYPENTSDHLPILSRFMLKSVITSNKFLELYSVLIYPNPTSGNLKIELGITDRAEVELFNINGQSLEIIKGNQKTIERKISKELTNQPAGVYILKLLVGNTIKTYKIVKE